MAVFRYHDFWHMHQPDGIYTGVVRQTGWQAYLEGNSQHVFVLPPTSLEEIAAEVKGIFGVRVVGDKNELHQRVGLFVGSPGPYWQLPSIADDRLDLLICGEVSEWELVEYVRDARTYGHALGLIIVGHQPTEESGMAYLAEWLEPQLPGIPVTHIPSGYPLTTI
jgi:putative NIF3 family GTP cyclohydrolase 1 type 2